MTIKQLLQKIIEGNINYFYSLDAENATIIKSNAIIHLDEEGNIYFKVAEIFSAVSAFTEDGKPLREAWSYADHVYLEKQEEIFEAISELQKSDYYKNSLIKSLYKRIK